MSVFLFLIAWVNVLQASEVNNFWRLEKNRVFPFIFYKTGSARVTLQGSCSSGISSSYFFRPSKTWSILHQGSIRSGGVQNKINKNLTRLGTLLVYVTNRKSRRSVTHMLQSIGS